MPDALVHIPWPFKREVYPGFDNPEYIGDVRVLTEGLMAGLAMMANLGPDDFAIISGFRYITDTPPSFYTPGYFYLKGTFYFMPLQFTENNWLIPITNDALTAGFNDGQTRAIYQNYTAIAQPADPVNGVPMFLGDMNAYRVGLDWLSDSVRALLAIASQLKSAAYADIGNTPGTVMAGDDPRAPYTALQLDARYAQIVNVILKNLGVAPPGPAYVPVNAWDPVNKAYSDATSGRRLASGVTDVGDADSGPGTTHTIAIGQTLLDNNYIVQFAVYGADTNPGSEIFYLPVIRHLTTTSFDIFFKEAAAGAQHMLVAWIIFDV